MSSTVDVALVIIDPVSPRVAVIGSQRGADALPLLGSVGMLATRPGRLTSWPSQRGYAFSIFEKPTGYKKPAYAIAVHWKNETVSRALAAVTEASDARRSEAAEMAVKIISR